MHRLPLRAALLVCLLTCIAGCGGGDDDQSSAAGAEESSGSDLPTLSSEEIEAALSSAGLVNDCSAYGDETAGDSDDVGTLNGVRNCYLEDGGSLTWRAYEEAVDLDPSWCAMRQQVEDSGIEPSEMGAVGVNGANFRLDGVSGTPITFESGLDGRAPLATAVWDEVVAALGGGELVSLAELSC
jgi:hypothetical protein